VVRRKFEHGKCYIFQNADNRIIFAIPYEGDYTLIGTTDADHGAEPGKPQITPEEIDYLCSAASEYFTEPVTRDDIVWTYSGVRPLYDDGASKAQEATRDYVIRQDGAKGEGVLLNIFGGKITTYRRLAEAIVKDIEAVLGQRQPAWTAGATLPGGDFAPDTFDTLVEALHKAHPDLDLKQARRLVRHYGTKAARVIRHTGPGKDFGHGLSEAEVRYLMAHEWARNADDILFRRTKLGIRFSKAERDKLQAFMDKLATAPAAGQVSR